MTLTEAAFWFKRFSKVGLGIGLLIMLIVLIAWKPSKTAIPLKYITASCACTPKAQDFTKHALTIPFNEIITTTLPSYEFQTETGKLDDNLPDIVNVYEYTNLGEQVNAQAKAKILAKKMGFDQDKVRKYEDKEYRWKDNQNQKELRVTAQDLNFSYTTTDNSRIIRLRKEEEFPSTDEAVTLATNALNSIGILDNSYTTIKPITYLINIEPNGDYTEAESLLDAELIRVDFLRQFSLITVPMNIQGAEGMVDSLEKRGMKSVSSSQIVNDQRIDVTEFITLVLNENPNKSNVSVYVGAKDESLKELRNIYQIDYKTWSIAPQSCGTYPLISADVAEERIKNGEGSLVFLNYNNDQVGQYAPQEVKKFLITSVNLVYYEGSIVQQYLQPVYFFSGQAELKNGKNASFQIYYPAVDYGNVTDEVKIEEVAVEEKGGLLPSL